MTQPLEMVRMLYNALGLMLPDIEWMHAGLALADAVRDWSPKMS
jgi:hypothetical protein